MCQKGTKSQDTQDKGVIINLPGRIIEGKCSDCGAALDYLFAEITAGNIQPPKFCPACNKPLGGKITDLTVHCGNCDEKIIDPQTEKFCRQCGFEIIYPKAES